MSIENMQLKQEDVLNDNVVLTDIFPISNTKSIDDSATGEKLQQTISRIWEAINNKLTRVVNSVNGRTGVVVLTKDDVGLGNVDDVSYDEIKEWVISQLEAYFQNKKLRLYETLDQVQADASTNNKNLAWTPYYCDHKDATDLRSVIGLFTWNPLTASLAWDNYRIINTIGGTDGSVFYRTTGDAENPAGVIGVNIGDGEELLYNDNGLRIDLSKLGSGMYFINKMYDTSSHDVFDESNFLLYGNLTDEQITENGAYAELRINGRRITTGPYILGGVGMFLINRNFRIYNQLQRNSIIITNFAEDNGTFTSNEQALMNRQPAIGTIMQTPTPLHPDNPFIIDFITIKPWTNGYGIKTIETHQNRESYEHDTQLAIHLGEINQLNNMSGLQTISGQPNIMSDVQPLPSSPPLTIYAPWGRINTRQVVDQTGTLYGGLYITTDNMLAIYPPYNFTPAKVENDKYNQQYHSLYFMGADGQNTPDRCTGSRMVDNYSWSRDNTVYDESENPVIDPSDGYGSTESLLTINLNKYYLFNEVTGATGSPVPGVTFYKNMSGLRENPTFANPNTDQGVPGITAFTEDELRKYGLCDGKDAYNRTVTTLNTYHYQGSSGGLSVNVGRFLEITPWVTSFAEKYYDGGKVQVRTSKGLTEDVEWKQYYIHVYEGYLESGQFWDETRTTQYVPNDASLYHDIDADIYYRWNGESYVDSGYEHDDLYDHDTGIFLPEVVNSWNQHYDEYYYTSEIEGFPRDPQPVMSKPTKLTEKPDDWETHYFIKYMKTMKSQSTELEEYAYLPKSNKVVVNEGYSISTIIEGYFDSAHANFYLDSDLEVPIPSESKNKQTLYLDKVNDKYYIWTEIPHFFPSGDTYIEPTWGYRDIAPIWEPDTYYNSNFVPWDEWNNGELHPDAKLYRKINTNRMTLDIDNDTLTFDENGKLKVANGGGGGGGGSTPSGNGVKMRFVDDRGYYFDTDDDKTTKPDICIKVGAGLNVVGSGNIPLDYMCSIADHKTALKEVCSAPVFTSYEYWLYHKNFYLPSQGITPITDYTMHTITLNSYPSIINARIDSATTRADLFTITDNLNSCITGFEEFIRTNADATVEFQNMEYTYPNLRMYFTGTKSALMKRIKNIQTAIYNLPQTNSDEYIQKLKKWELFAFQFEDYFDIEDQNPDMERGTPVEECLPMVILNGGEESFPLDWLFGYFTQEILCTDFVIISDICTPNGDHVSAPGWALLNSEPLNWTTEYSNYYVRTKNTSTNKWEYTQAQQTTNAPEWVVDTYYKYDSTASPQYSLTTSKPDNWDNVYSSYYTKTGENTYAQVAGVLGPPKFKLWKFWYMGDPNIPITGEFVLLRYRPDNWATDYNGYYKKTDATLNLYARVQGVMVIVAPEFEQNTYYEIVLPGYLYEGAFYNDAAHTNAYTPNETSLYHDISTDKYYRWQAEPAPGEFVEIDPPNSQP